MIAGTGVVLLVAAQATLADEAWTASGLEAPESVLYDASRDIFYVSNIAGALDAKDGNGFISILGPDGSLRQAQWVTGLNGPKGLAMSGDTLFVADIDRLVAIDVAGGKLIGTYPAEGAKFLNDTVVDADGRVFVSDTVTNRIYVLGAGALSVWLEDEGLAHPNGLAIEGGQLIVAAWGPGLRPDLTTEAPGHLLAVDLATKAIAPLGSGAAVGNLDGLEAEGNGAWLATDWIAGGLFRIQPDGTSEQLLDLNQGSADLEYLPEQKLAIIPMMVDGTIVAHRLD
jgi:sugar lactone lactonase YvrE